MIDFIAALMLLTAAGLVGGAAAGSVRHGRRHRAALEALSPGDYLGVQRVNARAAAGSARIVVVSLGGAVLAASSVLLRVIA